MSVFRIHYQSVPGVPHVHCHLCVAPAPNQTYAGCGGFTIRTGEEFEGLRRAMPGVQFEDVTGKVLDTTS